MASMKLVALTLATATLTVSACGTSKSVGGAGAPLTTTTTSPASSTQQATSSESPALTRAVLVRKADPICARVSAKRGSGKIRTIPDMIRVTSELSDYEREAITELSKLTPPSSLANDWRQILANMRSIADNTAKVSQYTRNHETQAANNLLVASNTNQQQIVAIASRDGFKDCAQAD